MDSKLDIVKLRVTANVITDWCNEKNKINLLSFNNSFISSYKKFRFTTIILEKLFHSYNDKKGYWSNGVFTFYEINNDEGNLSVSLLISSKDLKDLDRLNSFLKSNMINYSEDLIIVKTWNIFTSNNKLDNLSNALDHFFFVDLKKYEEELLKWINDNNYIIYDMNYELVEGAIKNISTDKYERNKEARQKCIEYHGTKCKICGFDFGKVYGDKLEGKIEVHHKKPLSEIKEEYVVDPINDLIPVCPNCHMVLHSEKDGVYTPEEVIDMLNNNK